VETQPIKFWLWKELKANIKNVSGLQPTFTWKKMGKSVTSKILQW
jgi:hypothetical protein